MKKILFFGAVILNLCAYSQSTVSGIGNILSGAGTNPTQYLGSGNSYDVVFKSSGVERMRILAGNSTSLPTIGIGTSTPNSYAGLHIHQRVLRLTGANGYGGPQLVLGGTESSVGEWGIEYQTAVVGKEGLNFWKPGTSLNYSLFLNNFGKVGINTNNPTAQLTVNGNMLIGDPALVPLNGTYKLWVQTGILTEKVKVAVYTTANWADFVFDDDYKLTPLKEVENFIKTNNHLPEMLSAEEMVEQGLDVAEMDAKLLQKIEELTLYLIEQDKKIIELQNQIEDLKK